MDKGSCLTSLSPHSPQTLVLALILFHFFSSFFFIRKVVIWVSHPNIITFSKPNNEKYDNQLLIWKVLSFLCTLSRLHLLCPNCPSISPAQHSHQHPNLYITLSHIKAFSHLSSLPKTQNLSFQFKNPNPKLQDDVKICLSACLEPWESKRIRKKKKTKYNSGRESGYPKTETLTSKCVLDLQIYVQDSFINKK